MTSFHHTDRAFKSFMRILEILPWPGQGGTFKTGGGLLTGGLDPAVPGTAPQPHPTLLWVVQGDHRQYAPLFFIAEVEVPEDKPSEHKRSVMLPKVVGGWYSLEDQIIKHILRVWANMC